MRGIAGNQPPSAGVRYGAATIALCGVQFVDVLGVTVVVTALPRMLADLGATPALGGAVVTTYAMFFGGLLMVAARVGDRVGHRRLVLAALTLFALAAPLAGSARSIWPLVVARALQGAAAAAAVPAALRLLTTVIPDGPPRRRAVAGWSATGAAAGACGFVIGGLVTELASWRLVYWMNVPVAVLLAGAVVAYVPEIRPPGRPERLGWPSALLLTGAAMGIVAGTTLFGEHGPMSLAATALGIGLLATAGFAVLEHRSRHPLVVPAARRSQTLRWGTLGSFVNTATTSGSFTLATLYLQDQRGLTSLATAGLLVSFSLLVVVGSLLAPKIMAEGAWGRALAAGAGIIAAGNSILVAYPEPFAVAIAAGTCGLGIGVASVAATDMGTTVDESIKATAAGALNTAAQLGTAIGTAIILLIATGSDPRLAWATAAGLAAVTAIADHRRAPSRRAPVHIDRQSIRAFEK